jgi:hypothetical protein
VQRRCLCFLPKTHSRPSYCLSHSTLSGRTNLSCCCHLCQCSTSSNESLLSFACCTWGAAPRAGCCSLVCASVRQQLPSTGCA